MPKKRPKQPKIVKNRSCVLINQRIANRNQRQNSQSRAYYMGKRKIGMEQAYQATNGRRTILQPSQIADFGKFELAKRLAPPHFYRTESSKFNKMFLTTSPNKTTKDFLKLYVYVEKINSECGPRESKMSKKDTFTRKRITFWWDQLEITSFWNSNRKKPNLLWKKLYTPRKMSAKRPKIDFLARELC